ncbi:MAG TPA: hypothetical protein VFP84_37830 [Kofleriaceae bacterium]|nr:hypothetical protein [Kofleriaceae bacterium]
MGSTDADSAQRLTPSKDESRLLARAPDRRLGLSWLDKQAAVALAEGDPVALAELVELARGCAEALAGEDANEARRRLLSRELAIAKATLDLLTSSIGDRVRAGDARGALLADRLATSAARRLAILAAEHRATCTPERRLAVVAIGHADVVHVEAE